MCYFIFGLQMLAPMTLPLVLISPMTVTTVIQIHERHNSQSLIVIGSVDDCGHSDDNLSVLLLGESLHSRQKAEEGFDLAPEGSTLVQQKLVAILGARKHLQEEGIRTRFCRTVQFSVSDFVWTMC